MRLGGLALLRKQSRNQRVKAVGGLADGTVAPVLFGKFQHGVESRVRKRVLAAESVEHTAGLENAAAVVCECTVRGGRAKVAVGLQNELHHLLVGQPVQRTSESVDARGV